jgi:streptogramin lyase
MQTSLSVTKGQALNILVALSLLCGCSSHTSLPNSVVARIQASSAPSRISGWQFYSLPIYAEGGDVALGHDGDLYTPGNVAGDTRSLVKIDMSGNETTFPMPGNVEDFYQDQGITSNPDGNIYALNALADYTFAVVQVTQSGGTTMFPLPFKYPADITLGMVTGSDNNLWILHQNGVGRMTRTGQYTEFGGGPWQDLARIVPGPDGNIWVEGTDYNNNVLVRVNVQDGSQTTYPMPADAFDLTRGPYGKLYCMGAKKMYVLDSRGGVTGYPITPWVHQSGATPLIMIAGPTKSGRLFWTTRHSGRLMLYSFNVQTHQIENRIVPPSGLGTPTVGSDSNIWFVGANLASVLLFN